MWNNAEIFIEGTTEHGGNRGEGTGTVEFSVVVFVYGLIDPVIKKTPIYLLKDYFLYMVVVIFCINSLDKDIVTLILTPIDTIQYHVYT